MPSMRATGQIALDLSGRPAVSGRRPRSDLRRRPHLRIRGTIRQQRAVRDRRQDRPAVQSFGSKGRLLVADEVVKFKYPEKDAAGYRMAAPAGLSQRHAVRWDWRNPNAIFPADWWRRWTARRERSSGCSAPFPRRRRTTGGRSRKTPGSAASASAAAYGRSRPSTPSSG